MVGTLGYLQLPLNLLQPVLYIHGILGDEYITMLDTTTPSIEVQVPITISQAQ
jgi:hypothetical protein